MNNRTLPNLLEILFITALITLFGLTTYTLVAVGGDSYSRILAKRDVNNDTRVALSYITTRVRQTNRTEDVSIRDHDGTQVLALTLRIDDDLYENRIYCRDGMLYEVLTPANDTFDPYAGEPVVALSDMQLSYVTDRDGAPVGLRMLVWAIADPGGGQTGAARSGASAETTLSLCPA